MYLCHFVLFYVKSLLTWNDKYQAKKIKFECLLRHSDKFIAGIFLRIDFQTKSSAGDNIHGECPGISGELEYTLVRGKKLLYDQDIIQLHVMKGTACDKINHFGITDILSHCCIKF